MATMKQELVLGIDVGTTTVKISVVDSVSKKSLQSISQETNADITSCDPLHKEQDVSKICAAVQSCLSKIASEFLQNSTKIGISGQMHGVMLWKQGEGWKKTPTGGYEPGTVSNLYTWQDGRCTTEFLNSLPKPTSHLGISTGYGCATLFWLQNNRPECLAKYDRAGTIQDYVVAMICGLNRPVMSIQNAASWGYVDTEQKSWNTDALLSSGFPVNLLPDISSSNIYAGKIIKPWNGIPESTAVGVALGDMQCSVLSTLHSESDAVLNISTSAQFSFIMPLGFQPEIFHKLSPVQYFPYFNGRYLAVAASLNGGNVLVKFVCTLKQWTNDLGCEISNEKIWETIIAKANDDTASVSNLTIFPTLFGERHLPEQSASIINVNPSNISLGRVFRSLCKGIIQNIHEMMPCEKLVAGGVSRIIGTGSALLRNPVLQKELELQYDLPVLRHFGGDAAFGAALAIMAVDTNVN